LGFFAPNADTGALVETVSLLLGTGHDNVNVAADGALWIDAHPKLLDLGLYMFGWSNRAPSQVIRAVPGAGGGGEARTMLLDLGERLSASSVAAAFEDQYLVGSLVDTRMLACRVSKCG
jgi:arylesterase/paraoxonase